LIECFDDCCDVMLNEKNKFEQETVALYNELDSGLRASVDMTPSYQHHLRDGCCNFLESQSVRLPIDRLILKNSWMHAPCQAQIFRLMKLTVQHAHATADARARFAYSYASKGDWMLGEHRTMRV
jgi:hypothetical protein